MEYFLIYFFFLNEVFEEQLENYNEVSSAFLFFLPAFA